MILINNDVGQLCNKLLLLASVYATAKDTNKKVYHLYWKSNEKLFRKTRQKDFAYPPISLRRLFPYYDRLIIDKRAKKYSDSERREIQKKKREIIRSSKNGGFFIVDDWYYRDYEALFRHRGHIVQVFQPTIETEKRINLFWEQLKCKQDTTTIGVHIRRGDYRVWQNGKYYFADEVYKKWMMDLANEMPNSLQFVLSSNEEINLVNFESELYSVCKAPGSQMTDLYTLARCDYIMGPPSTYSWWAAFYGNQNYLTLYNAERTISLSDFHKVEGEEFAPEYEK